MSNVIKMNRMVKGFRLVAPARGGRSAEEQRPAKPDNVEELALDPKNSGLAEASCQPSARGEFERGYREGQAQAEATLRERWEARLKEERQQIGRVLTSMEEQLLQWRRKAEETVVYLSVAIAEKILRREVATDHNVVIQQLRDSIRRVLGVESIKVRVHPSDETFVRDHRSSIMASTDSIREIIIEADPAIEQGGCIIESDYGNVDARLSTQLKKIESVLLNG